MGVLSRLGTFLGLPGRDSYPLSWQEYASYFSYNGNVYGIRLNQTLTGKAEPVDANFGGFVEGGLKGNGVVFACMAMRLRVFRQARMQFRQVRQDKDGGRQAGKLYGTTELAILEKPFGGSSTTADLMARAIQDVDLAGNFFAVRRPDRIRRLRPDWVDIILTEPEGDPDAETSGYVYYPGGRHSGRDPQVFDVGEVAHFAPIPDPIATFRGMSWLTPIVREIEADASMTRHRQRFMDNGATPNMIVKFPENVGREEFNEWRKTLREKTEGLNNAYKTMYLGGGADGTVVGANFRQLDFKVVQGAGETRIAAAAGIPPVIVGLSEGLAAATYSNYGQARRSFADTTCTDLWQDFAGSMANIVNVPPRSELWFDSKGIPFLREDAKDVSEIEKLKAEIIHTLMSAGFEADAIIEAVASEDISLLAGNHTGLFSVQLQAPGSRYMPEGEAPGEKPVGGGTAPAKQPASTPPPKPVPTGPGPGH